MEWLNAAYWLARAVLAVPMWFVSGIFLGGVELALIIARGLRLGQMTFGRLGNWLAYGEATGDGVDMKIERRLDRLMHWRDRDGKK